MYMNIFLILRVRRITEITALLLHLVHLPTYLLIRVEERSLVSNSDCNEEH